MQYDGSRGICHRSSSQLYTERMGYKFQLPSFSLKIEGFRTSTCHSNFSNCISRVFFPFCLSQGTDRSQYSLISWGHQEERQWLGQTQRFEGHLKSLAGLTQEVFLLHEVSLTILGGAVALSNTLKPM
jgi:hypothetical protein